MPILESFSQSAAAAKRNGNLIEILAVEATALHASGQSDSALDCLKQALALAEDADYARVFVDEGEPMRALLRQVYQQSKKNREDHFGFSRGYVERLLLELRGDGENTGVEKAETNDHKDRLVEPLSEREKEGAAKFAAIDFETIRVLRKRWKNRADYLDYVRQLETLLQEHQSFSLIPQA